MVSPVECILCLPVLHIYSGVYLHCKCTLTAGICTLRVYSVVVGPLVPFCHNGPSCGEPRRARGVPHNVRKPPQDEGCVRKDGNTLPVSVDYSDNLADMSDGVSLLFSFASISTGSSLCASSMVQYGTLCMGCVAQYGTLCMGSVV